jgi:sugar phosphate isomerase/epimerase
MLLGGTVAGAYHSPEEWEKLLTASRFRAITAPFSCRTPRKEIDEYRKICDRHGVVIAEIGVWKNLFDPNPAAAAEALEYAAGQLKLADETGIPCCVNIAGTDSAAGWDAADPSNYTEDTYERILRSVRGILDQVAPKKAFYCLEPMPWMIPDGPDNYMQLIRDVDRPQFAAHMDFVNMINSPRRYLAAEDFIRECITKLAPYIKSTHIKDSRMHPTRLTTILEECSPGEGTLDFGKILEILDRKLPAEAPVLLEHMTTFEEYRKAYDYLAKIAGEKGIGI